MNTSIDDYHIEELRSAYPYQFRKMSGALPRGWAPLFGIMCGLVDARLEAAGVTSETAKISIFGGWSEVEATVAGLRAYPHFVRRRGNAALAEEIYRLINDTAELSCTVCPVCGSVGAMGTNRRWHHTRCDTRHEAR